MQTLSTLKAMGTGQLLLVTALVIAGCSNPAKPVEPANASRSSAESPAIASEELRCLALSMYWEAKAEGDKGMLAVGHVVMNRVAHERFPDTPCNVVFDGGERPPCQFSWYCDGKSDRPTEAGNWAQAQRLAQQLMTTELKDPTGGALFFHGTGIKNPWRVPRTRTVTIGGHVFYKL